jgi:hypothetical protein
MEETPIYASVQTAQKLAKLVNETPVLEETGPVSDEVIAKFLSESLTLRKWIYNIAIAALIIVAAYQTGEAIAMESWANLVSVVLNLGGVGAVSIARVNAR